MDTKAKVYEFSITLKSQVEMLQILRPMIDNFMKILQADAKTSFMVQVTASEIFSNIIEHSYNFNSNQEVIILLKGVPADFIEITFKDFGESDFKFKCCEGINEDKENGRGIFLIKKLMDNFQITKEENINIHTIVKYINKS